MGEENMTKTKKEAMDQVEANALMSWKIAAQNAIRDLAGNNKEFVADDVWGLLQRRGVPAPREPRALGPMMKLAAVAGVIEWTGVHKQSRQSLNHQRPVVIWKSHIYRAKPVPKATVTVKRGGFLSWVKAIFTGRDRVIA
jgi:hypothetical protein